MKLLVTILILAVIGGGAWLVLSGDDASDETDATATAENETSEDSSADESDEDTAATTTTVTYTDDGFSPSTVGPLPVGSTVTFVNETSTDNFEPASDPVCERT